MMPKMIQPASSHVMAKTFSAFVNGVLSPYPTLSRSAHPHNQTVPAGMEYRAHAQLLLSVSRSVCLSHTAIGIG